MYGHDLCIVQVANRTGQMFFYTFLILSVSLFSSVNHFFYVFINPVFPMTGITVCLPYKQTDSHLQFSHCSIGKSYH